MFEIILDSRVKVESLEPCWAGDVRKNTAVLFAKLSVPRPPVLWSLDSRDELAKLKLLRILASLYEERPKGFYWRVEA